MGKRSRAYRRTKPQSTALATTQPQKIAVPGAKRVDISKFYKTVTPTQYDGDDEFISAAQQKPRIFDPSTDTDPWGSKYEVDVAHLYEVSPDGSSYRIKTIRGTAKFKESIAKGGLPDDINEPWNLREAGAGPELSAEAAKEVLSKTLSLIAEGVTDIDTIRERLRESFDGGINDNIGGFSQDWVTPPSQAAQYGSGIDPYAEYIPLMGGPWSKQLYLQQFLEMHAKAFEAFNHNPAAKQIIELTTSFALSRGIDYVCTNVEVDEVVKEFLERTDFLERLETQSTDAGWSGNLMNEFFDNTPNKGQLDFREIDPSTIWDIITDPEDIRKVYYAHQQYSTQYQNLYTLPTDKRTDIPIMKYIIRHIPAANWLHMKRNCSAWEKFGRSDLFNILGWLKRLKDLMNARVIKGQVEAAFVWDVELATDSDDVSNANLSLPDPFTAGATFIHNRSVKLTPQQSGIKGNEAIPDVTELKTLIAIGAMTPKEFLGVADRGSRTASLTSTEYGTKRYERFQLFIERYCHRVIDRVISVAANAGLIDLDEVLKDARSVRRLADDDIQTRNDVAQDLQQITSDKQDAQTQINDSQQKALTTGQPTNGKPPKPVLALTSQTLNEAAANLPQAKDKPLNDKQKRRIGAIKKSGKFSRELIEWAFPSIAQEDRSAKLKDIALAEAMEWLPKEVAATMAAKELNITTYEFGEAWRMIVAEALAGMSLAHVYGQDNKHVPSVVQAQSVQEEHQALDPTASGATFQNVPVPPVVNGMKQVPGGPPPGQKPNSGDTKINNKQGPSGPANPTSQSPGYSAAANHPGSTEGRANQLRRLGTKEVNVAEFKRHLYAQVLMEALSPLISSQSGLARYILSTPEAVSEFEEAVAQLDS